ncbi:hypothetical protein, partial [Lonsdalea populi]|uniref:hypothetical protein n=1 Tax=Lonsdalea populi TaxID=1172565 RepID=UPI001C65EC47
LNIISDIIGGVEEDGDKIETPTLARTKKGNFEKRRTRHYAIPGSLKETPALREFHSSGRRNL